MEFRSMSTVEKQAADEVEVHSLYKAIDTGNDIGDILSTLLSAVQGWSRLPIEIGENIRRPHQAKSNKFGNLLSISGSCLFNHKIKRIWKRKLDHRNRCGRQPLATIKISNDLHAPCASGWSSYQVCSLKNDSKDLLLLIPSFLWPGVCCLVLFQT